MHPLLYLSEQYQQKELTDLPYGVQSVLTEEKYRKYFLYKPALPCFELSIREQKVYADTNYLVGVDWLVSERAAVYIEPKLNGVQQVNFFEMLLQSLEAPENLGHLDGLFHVDYDQTWIEIPEQRDLLSPLLIVQFLKLVQKIVRKGLKKSYYRVTENLNSRVKGKILVGQQVKTNIVKNRLTKTVCNFQEYGVNTRENQFLKLVLEFVSSYLSQKSHFFSGAQNRGLQDILHYCLPSFEQVEVLQHEHQKIHVHKNVFYKEYEEAVKIGTYILKRFSFNINKISQSQTTTPPFWIDMSKLFELYVFGKLKKIFPLPDAVTYHDTFWGGKETDILIREAPYKCVVDCKYKPRYKDESPELADKRQLAGYTRLKSVYEKLGVPVNELVRGVIIYAHQGCPDEIKKEDLFETDMGEYVEFYKLGVSLPKV